MDEIKIVSLDVEGTLATTDFSSAVWFEAIPRQYAERYGVGLERARQIVEEEYRKVGDQRLEWYDIQYWLDRLGLGLHGPVMEQYSSRVAYYPEVKQVLASLHGRYRLVVASGSERRFLRFLLEEIEPYFTDIFSSVSDFQELKTSSFYVKLCQAIGVRPGQVLHVGDNWQSDFVAPGEAGIRALHLDRREPPERPDSLTSLIELESHLSGPG